MTPQHALTTTFLLALAASAGAQGSAKPAPQLPPFLPDLKTPAVYAPTTPAVERPEPTGFRRATPAKDPNATGPAPASVLDFTRVHFDEPGDGRTWVRARTYKASFDGEGATYIPFLGSQAPRNFPVRVQLDSATVGGAPLALEMHGVSRDGSSVAIDRGAVREVWHMGLDSAEQTFEIASRPAAQGALELRLALETELSIRAEGAGFALDGAHGGVRIGRATAVDADGRRLDLSTRLEGVTLAIEVPAEFTRSARYPLVVDPLYSSNPLEGFTNECSVPDVANAGASGYYAATYEFAFSATDADLYTVDLYYGLPVAGSGTWVDATTNLWQLPSIAYNALHDTFLTVAQVRTTTSAPKEIWCRARYAGTGTQFGQTLVQNAALGSCFYADVGGDPALSGPTYFFAAWTRAFSASDWDVHARLIGWDGVPVASTIFLENSGAFDWYPSVSKTDGRPPFATQNWNIAWMRNVTSSNLDILGAQVRWDGAVTTAAFTIEAGAQSDTNPAASSPLDGAVGPRPWMVAFERNVGDLDIQVTVLSGATVLVSNDLSVLENEGQLLENQIQPDVDSNGQRFVVAYSESYQGSTTDRDGYLATLALSEFTLPGLLGLRVDEGHVNFDFSARDTYGAQIACGVTEANYGFGTYGLVWPRSGAGPGDVFCGAYYEPATYENFCFGDGTSGPCPCGNTGGSGRGCANSATIGAGLFPSGAPNIAADSFSLFAFGMPGSTTCLFFQGTLGSAAASFGDVLRCVSGTVVRIGTKNASGGNATYPEAGDPSISVRGLVPAVGAERRYQAWYRNAASFCTPSTFNTTSGVRVRWLR
ncbi:MAG: hypothetical protein NTY35_04530 [Planctomycetota bacterium]|nr:hypothetical protein [Planctomycetota bacterium]